MSFYFKINYLKNPHWMTRFYYQIKTKIRKEKPYFSRKLFLEHHQTAQILKEELTNDKTFHKRFDDHPLIQISASYFCLYDIDKQLKKSKDTEALQAIVHVDDVIWK